MATTCETSTPLVRCVSHTVPRYGVVLKELGCRKEAREAQLTSISLQPLFWGAWSELANLCDNREMVSTPHTPTYLQPPTLAWCVLPLFLLISWCVLPQLFSLNLPYHWLKDFFLATASLELSLVEDALAYYTNLSLVGFGSSSYITSQLALVNYNKKGGLRTVCVCDPYLPLLLCWCVWCIADYESACVLFGELRRRDPHRLTDLDVFSHMLFVMVNY